MSAAALPVFAGNILHIVFQLQGSEPGQTESQTVQTCLVVGKLLPAGEKMTVLCVQQLKLK